MSAAIDKPGKPDQEIEPIVTNGSMTLLSDGGTALLTLRLGSVSQRNWSRIASALTEAPFPGAQDDRVFIKQFVDAGGVAHEVQWDFEREGAELAGRLFGETITVPRLLHADRDHLLHVYEHVEMLSIDDLLRGDPARLERLFPPLLEALRGVLALLDSATASVATSALTVKNRPYGGASTAVNFKGMDIRNVGLRLPTQKDSVALTMFDFGRPYLAPLEEAGAKLFVSIGMLNWGRPLHRFVRGPDQALLQRASAALGDYLDCDSVLAEIDYQQRIRESDVKAANPITLALKTFGLRTIGRGYLRRLAAWSKENLAQANQ
jgi:hypothetical protein